MPVKGFFRHKWECFGCGARSRRTWFLPWQAKEAFDRHFERMHVKLRALGPDEHLPIGDNTLLSNLTAEETAVVPLANNP